MSDLLISIACISLLLFGFFIFILNSSYYRLIREDILDVKVTNPIISNRRPTKDDKNYKHLQVWFYKSPEASFIPLETYIFYQFTNNPNQFSWIRYIKEN